VDLALFHRLYGGTGAWLFVMAALTIVGSGWTMIPIAALAAFDRTRAHALRLVALLAGVAVLVFSLKALVGRARPCACLAHVHALVFATPHDPSFPSGHAAGAFTVAAFVAFEARVHPAAKVALFVIAAGIALSRVVLGVHFPSDIAAGALLGVVVAAGYSAVRRALSDSSRRSGRPSRARLHSGSRT
jgi:undecaprenyl-diphosphatase